MTDEIQIDSEGLQDIESIHTVDLKRSKISRTIWFSLGFVIMVIGIIGIIVPGLPTTPLMILAAACFAKSSQRFYDWIINNKLFGHHVKNYREGKGIPKSSKPIILSTLWLFVLFATFIGIPDDILVAKISVLILALVGTVFILRIKDLDD